MEAILEFVHKWWITLDKHVFFCCVLLMVLGNIFVSVASPVVATRIGTSANIFIVKNLIFSLLSVGLLVIFSMLSERQIVSLSAVCFAVLIMLLVVVLCFGPVNKGARRWIHVFGFSLQPSEIIKPFFVILTSYCLTVLNKTANLNIICAMVLYVVLALLLVLQPNISAILLITFVFALQLFLIMVKLKYFLLPIPAFAACLVLLYFTFPHFHNRINTFVKSSFADGEKSYQVQKSVSAISNGGILGKGLFEGTIKNYIPDAHTDFIFSVIGEEFGAVVCLLLIAIYFYMTFRLTLNGSAEGMADFYYISVTALSFQVLFQAVINIGVSLNLLPTTGVTLPFISYGGSSMISASITFGILLSLTKKTFGNIKHDFGTEVNLYSTMYSNCRTDD